MAGLKTPPPPPDNPLKGAVLRFLHAFTGHPRSQTYWGEVSEGATCACGAHWTIADMQM